MGGIGLSPGPNPKERITIDELKCARWIYQNYSKLKLKSMVLSKTCLIDNLINKHMSKLFNEYNIDESIDSFEMLETQEENYKSLESENQSVYTMMVEYVWRTLSLETYFKTTDNSFIRAQDKISKNGLRHNQKVWQMAYGFQKKVDIEPLEWFKLWKKRFISVKPIILLDPVEIQESDRKLVITEEIRY